MLSLRWKLALALLLVVGVSVGLTAYLANRGTASEFQRYVSQGRASYSEQVTQSLSDFYSDTGSWSGVQSLVSSLPTFGSYRLIVSDNSGVIVADTQAKWLGDPAASKGLGDPTVVSVSGQEVGSLYLLSPGQGQGSPGGRGGPPQPVLDTQQQDFLSRVNRSLLIAGIAGAMVAIMLGLFLTRQFTRPIRGLREGAARIATGDLAYRVKDDSGDEFGDLARSFNSMAASLDSSEQARQRLLADIAHELRTPLSVIEGTVDAMLDGVYEPSASNLGSIKEETAILTRLVADLRDLSLAESGQLKLEIEPTDLARLVERRVSQVEVMARGKNVNLRTHLDEGLPEVEVDGNRIEQVVANLLSNALNHTPPGGTIVVSVASTDGTESHPGDREEVVVSVADTGEGIPAEHLPHIFERFYRVDDSRSRKAGGAGLGLAVVKQMVELHGGRIWAESVVGKGSRFSFALPLRRRADTE